MNLRVFKTVIISFIIAALVTGCAANTNSEQASGEKNFTIVTSFYPIYIHTINITKGIPGVNVVNMTEPQKGCLHDYTITTDDMKVLSDAQVFVINGAGMEAFMDKVVKQLPSLKVVEASKGIELIKENGKDEDSSKNNEQTVNPHVWVSITNAIQQVKNIGEELAVIDPGNASKYRDNTEAYVNKLEKEKEKMHKVLDGIKKRDIITFHEAFPYFAKEFNLNIAAVIEREPGSDPGAQELKDTVDIIKKQKIYALFAEPQYSSKAADTIARETGAKVYILDPAVTGEANGDTDAYINIMEKNLKVLKEALG